MNILSSVTGRVSLFAASVLSFIQKAAAADLGDASEITRVDGGSAAPDALATAIENIVIEILGYVALIAVIVVIIAGITLLVSGGNDAQKDQAKKIIIYAFAGIIIILLSAGIVGIVL